MRKLRFLAGLLALLLLLTLVACSDDSPTENPPAGTPLPTPGNGAEGNGEADGEPNTDPDAHPETDPGTFLQQNGYPMTFAIQFTKDGYGFDTATGNVLNGSETVKYNFGPDDYRDLYRCLDEGNLWTLPTDLTYSKLAGASAPEGPGAQYQLTVATDDQAAKTYRIDSAAISLLQNDPQVSNMSTIVNYLYACVEMYHAAAK